MIGVAAKMSQAAFDRQKRPYKLIGMIFLLGKDTGKEISELKNQFSILTTA